MLRKFIWHLFLLQSKLSFLKSEWITEEWFWLAWSKWFKKKKVERIEWYKKSKEVN